MRGGREKTKCQNFRKRQQCFELCNFLMNWLCGKNKELHQNLSELLVYLIDFFFANLVSSLSQIKYI